MITYSAFTTFNRSGYEEYGFKNIDSFVKFWPKDIYLFVYSEGFSVRNTDKVRNRQLNISELAALKERCKNNPKLIGKSNPKKYDFLFDYVKFSHKSFVIVDAIENLTTDWVIWLDGDVISHSHLSYDFIKSITPLDCLVSYLGRKNKFSETGFLAFNRRHPQIMEYAELVKNIYNNDLILDIDYFKKGYTDCHVFDYAISKLSSKGVKVNNLSGKYEDNPHPFINSDLGMYMDHLKGPRKEKGKSRDIDLKNSDHKSNEYWSQ